MQNHIQNQPEVFLRSSCHFTSLKFSLLLLSRQTKAPTRKLLQSGYSHLLSRHSAFPFWTDNPSLSLQENVCNACEIAMAEAYAGRPFRNWNDPLFNKQTKHKKTNAMQKPRQTNWKTLLDINFVHKVKHTVYTTWNRKSNSPLSMYNPQRNLHSKPSFILVHSV